MHLVSFTMVCGNVTGALKTKPKVVAEQLRHASTNV